MKKLTFASLILCAALFFMGSLTMGQNAGQYKGPTMKDFQSCTKCYVDALNKGDRATLAKVVDGQYLSRLNKRISADPAKNAKKNGRFRHLPRSMRIFDAKTGCFYVERELNGMTRVECVTFKVRNNKAVITHGPCAD